MKNWYQRMIDWVFTYIYDECDYEHITLETHTCSECGHYGDLVNGRCVNGC